MDCRLPCAHVLSFPAWISCLGLSHDLFLILGYESYIVVQILMLPPLSPFPLDFSHLFNLFKLLTNKLVNLFEPQRGVRFNEEFIASGVCVCVCVCECVCVWTRTQSCPTLCDPMCCSPPGSSVHGIFQARILEQVAIPSSKGSSWPR